MTIPRIRRTLEDFIEYSNKVHNNKYSYDKVVYTGVMCKIIITCPIHGDWKQAAHKHLAGQGCRMCVNSAKSLSEVEFKERCSVVHNNKYSYEDVVLTKGLRSIIEIGCPAHGTFSQAARFHIKGQGCPSCEKTRV